ncbi:MAG TPA: hypothetical protein VLR94_11330, partial [Acidobacteriota bacterium]|nr:hypothetical protein [Acidobacteriota bacterium]
SYQPNCVLMFRPAAEENPRIVKLAPFTLHQVAIGGKATAYVCQSGRCQAPVTAVEEMLKALR